MRSPPARGEDKPAALHVAPAPKRSGIRVAEHMPRWESTSQLFRINIFEWVTMNNNLFLLKK